MTTSCNQMKITLNWAANDWLLSHDNVPPHCSLTVKKYLVRHSDSTLKRPPYSPNLAPADFYLFHWVKMKLKGNHFVNSDEMIKSTTRQLKDLSENGFQMYFDLLI